MAESESKLPFKIAGQVVIDQKGDGRTWWVEKRLYPDGSTHYARTVSGGPHAPFSTPVENMDPEDQKLAEQQYQAATAKIAPKSSSPR